jgi:hypothetical protein
MSFTGAFRIYFGIHQWTDFVWRAVTVKFRADNIEPGGFLSMGECLVSSTRTLSGVEMRVKES